MEVGDVEDVAYLWSELLALHDVVQHLVDFLELDLLTLDA